MNHVMLPPVRPDATASTGATVSTTVNGRTYNAAPGSVVTGVPGGDARKLEANGWINGAGQGSQGDTTANRPTATASGQPLPAGTRYVDTTTGAVIVWDGVTWRNPATGAAV